MINFIKCSQCKKSVLASMMTRYMKLIHEPMLLRNLEVSQAGIGPLGSIVLCISTLFKERSRNNNCTCRYRVYYVVNVQHQSIKFKLLTLWYWLRYCVHYGDTCVVDNRQVLAGYNYSNKYNNIFVYGVN